MLSKKLKSTSQMFIKKWPDRIYIIFQTSRQAATSFK